MVTATARAGKLAALALVLAFAAAAPAAQGAIVINEVESQPVDWIELYNTGAAPVNIAGYGLDDGSGAGPSYDIPAGTTIAAGGFYATPDNATDGLGNPDGVRLFDTGDVLIDSFSYGPHAARTYARCPDGTGALVQSLAATRNAANSCIAAGATWPGATSVATASNYNFLANLSGLAYQPSGTSARGVLWASRNNATAALFRLVPTGATFEPDPANGWASGKQIFFPDGGGVPDAEGLTLVGGDPNAMFASIERNDAGGAASDTPRPGVLRFDVSGAGATLTATREWALGAASIGVTDSNQGLEAITWIPDSVLVAKGFRDEAAGTAYTPSVYPDHGSGLFFVGVEQTGQILAYVLNQTTGTSVKIATIESGFPAVMSLDYEPESRLLWAACDDTCDGKTATFDVAASGGNAGQFFRTAIYNRPSGAANLNNEGFAIAPRAECVGGFKPVFYADDSNTAAVALRSGTLNCTALPTVSVGSATVTEGNSGAVTLSAPVTLSAVTNEPVTVTYATGGGTALAGTDYTAVPAGTVTIAAGQTAGVAAVSVTGDTVDEGASETFNVTLSAPVGASLGTASAAQTITDDDDPPVATPTATATATTTATATASPTPADTTKPVITGLKAARSGVRFSLSEAARVTVTVRKRKKQGFKLVKAFSLSQAAGARTVAFKGRVPKAAIKRGKLKITVQATDAAGNRSTPQTKTVR